VKKANGQIIAVNEVGCRAAAACGLCRQQQQQRLSGLAVSNAGVGG
jgi:hypothetical protein